MHVYAVKNDITNDIRNLREEKKFVTNGEFINRLQLNLNEIPIVLVDGKPFNLASKIFTILLDVPSLISKLFSSRLHICLKIYKENQRLIIIAIVKLNDLRGNYNNTDRKYMLSKKKNHIV